MTPRFSIVTATKDRPEWLPGCLECVQEQTFTDWEHIIMDVGTVHHPTLYRDEKHTHALGVSAGLTWDSIAALSFAKGEIVTLLHDDDRLPPDALEIVDREIGDADWLIGATVFRDEAGESMYVRGGTRESFDATMRGDGNLIGAAVYWRREFLQQHMVDPAYDGAQDFEQYLRMGRASPPKIIPDVLHIYNDHPGSYSNRMRGVQIAAMQRARETWCST